MTCAWLTPGCTPTGVPCAVGALIGLTSLSPAADTAPPSTLRLLSIGHRPCELVIAERLQEHRIPDNPGPQADAVPLREHLRSIPERAGRRWKIRPPDELPHLPVHPRIPRVSARPP